MNAKCFVSMNDIYIFVELSVANLRLFVYMGMADGAKNAQ